MTAPTRLAAVALVVVVLLAGCGAGIDGSIADGGSGQPAVDGPSASEAGTLAFYVSDRPTAIGDFERLTVTVTEIGVHRTDAGNGTDDDAESAQASTTVTETPANGTSNETVTTNATATAGSATEEPEQSESDGDAGWLTHDVANATVDLTRLQGENATQIANVGLPAGEYNGVYVAVSNVTGVLTTGETVDVKLPSDRLRLNKGFVLGTNRTTSFVFDIAVHEAGGSGKYVLRPVVGQSGPDVPIREAGARPAAATAPDENGDDGPPADPGKSGQPAADATRAGGQSGKATGG